MRSYSVLRRVLAMGFLVGLVVGVTTVPARAVTDAKRFREFPVPTGWPYGITAGPDGNLWFTEYLGNKIGRITTAGVITEFQLPTADSDPWEITAGPDGNLWFTEYRGHNIGRITTAGVITEFQLPTAYSYPQVIAPGPDGNLWFTEQLGNNIGRITTSGVITEFPVPTGNSQPWGITAGLVSGPPEPEGRLLARALRSTS